MSSAGGSKGSAPGKVLKRATTSTIQDKFMVGYQGWFTCGGDGQPIGDGHHGWLHWVNEPITPPFNGRPNTDLWPDTSAYDPSELYEVAGLTHKDGSAAKVFSSRDPRTVGRHFRWMAEHGVDGAFLQRFVGQVDPEEHGNRDAQFGGTLRLRDEIGRRIMEAAETEGRVWAIMYDVSGVPADKVHRIITQDFNHLLHDERILDSPAYLHERGNPVVAVWGFGLSDSSVSPHAVREVFNSLRDIYRTFSANPEKDLYIFAGTPSHWREPGQGDAHGAPGWSELWLGASGCVDAISPWSVGRYSSSEEVERWAEQRWGPDAEAIANHNQGIVDLGRPGRKVDYVPVVLPGGSGFNLSEGNWAFNGIKRVGGKFLWSQIFHAKRLKGVRSMYGAMWDEYDEGTAFLPVIPKAKHLPDSEKWPFLGLDEDGFDLPSDWYMRIAGFAAEGLRSERRVHDTFPNKELQDYWGTRPRYEDTPLNSASSSSGPSSSTAPLSFPSQAERERQREAARERERAKAAAEAKAQFDAWSEEQARKEAEKEEMPPPAYSLEDENPNPVPVAEPSTQPQAPVAAQGQQPPAPQAPLSASPQQQQTQLPSVDSLANELGRTGIGSGSTSPNVTASSPPALPERRESGRAGAGTPQGVGLGLGLDRPPLHPAHPQAGRTSSGSSGGYGQPQQPPPQHPQQQQVQNSIPAALRAGSRDSYGSAPGGSVGGYAGVGTAAAAARYGPHRVSSPEALNARPQSQQSFQQPQLSPGALSPSLGGPNVSPQHTGVSGPSANCSSPPTSAGYAQQTFGQPAASSSSYAPPGRPTSMYPGQPASHNTPTHSQPPYGDPTHNPGPPRPATTHPVHSPPMAGPGASLGYSASVSARPPNTLSRPGGSLSAGRPTSSWSQYPGGGGRPEPQASASSSYTPPVASSYPPPQGPPAPLTSLAPRPDSAHPTTPAYGHSPAPHSGYAAPYPASNVPYASPSQPAVHLPSPDLSASSYPGGGSYSSYQQPGPYPGSSTYTQGPSFPSTGGDPGSGYFYQPQSASGAPSFPTAAPGSGYAPQQDSSYYTGAWGQPPPMPHRPGSQPYPGQPAYGSNPNAAPGPNFPSPTTAPAQSGPFGFSMSSVDKLVGRRTREQLEGHVDRLTDSSTKLFNKFR
ncbi:hypothetical protein MKEN_00585800 [Mycena kentingensis (nom. inval.)]|nr:hypothetical protein MKEN_00585800 [Mycena kentingensis (nom. inval.)]